MHERLRAFTASVAAAVDAGPGEPEILARVQAAMRELVARDDWLAPAFAVPDPRFYQQYLLHCDPQQRFSVVSFVWGPGQQTPVHDHTVWGVIGMLRGAEVGVPYRLVDGLPQPDGEGVVLRPGDVDRVSPSVGDVHQVRNLSDRDLAISIHCYGADIGRVQRHVFTPGSREVKPFVSGYAQPRVAPAVAEGGR
jgi:predicted metal-dependent enzyme (double-stranded beta helix superfamily)